MELFRLFGSIAIDNTKAKSALNETSSEAQSAADETSAAFEKIGGVAGKIALGIGAAGLAIGGAFVGAVESTREYREQMGLLDAAFQTSGHSSEAAKNTYSDLNAVLGDTGQAVEASQHLAKLVENEKDLQTWTDICTGVYATFGASLPIEGLTEASNETAKTGILTGGLVDALNWAGIGEEQFQAKLDACTTEQERQKLIMDTLNSTYKDASAQYQLTNADVIASRQAQERLSDAMAEVGKVGEPVMTAIKNAIASMAEKAVPVIQKIIDKIRDMKKWMQDNQNTVKAWIAVLIVATTTISGFILLMKWQSIMSAASKAVKLVTVAIKALNVAMKANVIGIIVSAIIGLVAAFIYLWNNCDSFRNFWIKLWDKIKSVGGKAIDWIKNKFNTFKSALSTVRSVFDNIKDAISDKIESAKDAVKKAIDKIKGFFKFSWSLPKLKMPSIGIKGKFSIDPPSVPKFSIKWNAEGGILTQPTIFGLSGNTLLGGGESGDEAIAPIELLQGYTRQAVSEGIGTGISVLVNDMKTIIELLQQLIQRNIYLDSGVLVGELMPALDVGLSDMYIKTNRGNTR